MVQGYAYLIHLLTAFILLGIFFAIYTRITPFNELQLIRRGNMAAAISFGGAMIGYCLTLASSIVHNDNFSMFLVWGAGALVVQAVTYAAISRMISNMSEAIEDGNTAMGTLMGTVSLAVGIVNAACLS